MRSNTIGMEVLLREMHYKITLEKKNDGMSLKKNDATSMDEQVKNLDVHGKQYGIEVQEWYWIKEKNIDLQVDKLKTPTKIEKQITLLCKEVNKNFYCKEENLKNKDLYEIICYIVIKQLTTKTICGLKLPSKTYDRHEILSEIYNHIQKITIFYTKNTFKDLKKMCFLLGVLILDHLEEEKIILKKTIILQQNKIHDGSHNNSQINEDTVVVLNNAYINLQKHLKTIYIYKVNKIIEIPHNINNWYISLIPLSEIVTTTKTIYTYALTFNSIHKVTIENKLNNKHILLEDINIINKIKELKLYINPALYALIKKQKNVSNQEDFLEITLQNIKTQLSIFEKIIKQKITLKNVQKKMNKTKFINYLETMQIKLQQEINKNIILLDFLIIEKESNLINKPLYFMFTLDFRGRLYYKSKISPQNSHLVRYIYDYGDIENTKLKKSAHLPIQYKEELAMIGIDNTNLKIVNEGNTHIIFGLLIEFAKIVKNDYIELYQGKIKINEFLQLGLKMLKNKDSLDLSEEKKIQLNYINYIGEQVIEKNNYNREYIIYKDATASALQLLCVILHPAKQEIIVYLNLMSNQIWYDTYYFIIQLFKENYNLNKISEVWFTRQTLKKTIMTYNYAATYFTCWQNFKKLLEEAGKNYRTEEWRCIQIDFRAFFIFLDKLFNSKEFFKNSMDEQTQQLINQFAEKNAISIKSEDNATIYLHYLKPVLKRWTIQVNKKRKTIQIQETNPHLDLKKTRQAIKPNTTHAVDALLVRETLRDLIKPIVTIHDCFGISVYNVDELIYSLNKNMNNLKKKQDFNENMVDDLWFSIFIVL